MTLVNQEELYPFDRNRGEQAREHGQPPPAFRHQEGDKQSHGNKQDDVGRCFDVAVVDACRHGIALKNSQDVAQCPFPGPVHRTGPEPDQREPSQVED